VRTEADRFGEVLPTDEIDLSAGAVVLDASYAQRLLDDAASAPRRGAGFGAGSAASLIVFISPCACTDRVIRL
jgi:hypothetical protein